MNNKEKSKDKISMEAITKEFVSVIIPCRNEKAFIKNVLDDMLNQDYPRQFIAVLVIDGMSDDGTRDIILSYAQKYGWIKMLDNLKKTAPCALNIGIKNSKGYVLRVDAHSRYPYNYISKLYDWSKNLNADNVGCPVVTVPGNDTLKALSISRILAHPFGVGNAYFRLGVNKPKEVDTVMFGFFKPDVFDKIGLFDEELTRNQDDEFNARLKRAGGKIYLVPELEFTYFARSTFSKLWQMYFQYGLFKPLVNKKIGLPSNIRQLVPIGFISSLIISLIVFIFNPLGGTLFISILALYALFNLTISIKIAKKDYLAHIFYNFIGFCIVHFSYGFGYLKGILYFVIFNKMNRPNKKEISLSR